MEERKERWIMVSDGTPQMFYAGKTNLSEEGIDEAMEHDRTIVLTECRAMRTLLMPTPDGNVSQRDMLSPISIARGGIRLTVKVVAYFWPDEHELTNKSFMETLKPALQAETAHRAKEAGIITPDQAKNQGGKFHS